MSRLGALLVVVLLVLAGCGGTSAPEPRAAPGTGTASAPGPGPRYVALGDSYTAAPYVPLTDIANGCLRSDGNYPHLLAKAKGLTLVDVSCGGATSADLAGRQQTFGHQSVPPQLKALTPSTTLVTLGLGGNDGGLFGSLSNGCQLTDGRGKPYHPGRGGNCGHVDLVAANATIARVGRNLVADLHAVRRRAPHARLVLVGYPHIASATRTCPALPVGRTDAVAIDGITRKLRDAMRVAARKGGASFIDMYTASAGHDVCAGARAWVNGIHTDQQRAAALHPFAAEQQAVADRIARLLG